MDSMQRKKPATISIEFVIGIFSVLIVLFVVLGIFSANLLTMANSSGIRNMFKNSNSEAKTVFESSNNSALTNTVAVPTQP